MDPTDPKYLEDEDSPKMKVFGGVTSGLVSGTIWGTIVATWYDVPHVERSVMLPGLIRTLKMMGNYGVTFAAIGGVYIGVEQVVQHYCMKEDFVNGAIGGFAAGATVFGYKGYVGKWPWCCCCFNTKPIFASPSSLQWLLYLKVPLNFPHINNTSLQPEVSGSFRSLLFFFFFFPPFLCL
ncbi:hypothetical protein Dimus_001560 [Dionaea muscipula]